MTKIILAARHNSTRLPQKALLKLLDKTILEISVLRLRKCKNADGVILATTRESFPYFKEIIDKLSLDFYIGSEEDVLDRYVKAAEKYRASAVVRATADNPLVAIKASDLIIEHHKNTNADLSHFDNLPYGSGVEVIEYEALKKANEETDDAFSHEHITQYHYKNPGTFKIESPPAIKIYSMPNLRVTVDTKEDYENVKNIFEYYRDIYVDIDKIIEDKR